MSESIQFFRSAWRARHRCQFASGFSALILYPPGCAQEGSLFKGFPTWRFRVLKTALRLRLRRALSSASGQKPTFRKIGRKKKSLNFEPLVLTNHIPEIRGKILFPLFPRVFLRFKLRDFEQLAFFHR
jgi:hypothetical protein